MAEDLFSSFWEVLYSSAAAQGTNVCPPGPGGWMNHTARGLMTDPDVKNQFLSGVYRLLICDLSQWDNLVRRLTPLILCSYWLYIHDSSELLCDWLDWDWRTGDPGRARWLNMPHTQAFLQLHIWRDIHRQFLLYSNALLCNVVRFLPWSGFPYG